MKKHLSFQANILISRKYLCTLEATNEKTKGIEVQLDHLYTEQFKETKNY